MTARQPGDHRVCFIGDSFVQGAGDPECRGWVGRVAAHARTSGFDVSAYNLGVRGNTSGDVLARWERESVLRYPPGCARYIVFSFGANDAYHENGASRVAEEASADNFSRLLQAARAQHQLLAVGPPPVSDDPAHDHRIVQLCTRYQERAQALAIPYLPLASRLLANDVWRRDVAVQDGTHPGAAGYALLAALVLEWPAWWFQPR